MKFVCKCFENDVAHFLQKNIATFIFANTLILYFNSQKIFFLSCLHPMDVVYPFNKRSHTDRKEINVRQLASRMCEGSTLFHECDGKKNLCNNFFMNVMVDNLVSFGSVVPNKPEGLA